ncbi:Uncharacterised protein [Mycobacteroides abscessus subsp. abscessus]|nr:Uncharacterised protein [Mycobacteroides abscessus subsp. abscessus]
MRMLSASSSSSSVAVNSRPINSGPALAVVT